MMYTLTGATAPHKFRHLLSLFMSPCWKWKLHIEVLVAFPEAIANHKTPVWCFQRLHNTVFVGLEGDLSTRHLSSKSLHENDPHRFGMPKSVFKGTSPSQFPALDQTGHFFSSTVVITTHWWVKS